MVAIRSSLPFVITFLLAHSLDASPVPINGEGELTAATRPPVKVRVMRDTDVKPKLAIPPENAIPSRKTDEFDEAFTDLLPKHSISSQHSHHRPHHAPASPSSAHHESEESDDQELESLFPPSKADLIKSHPLKDFSADDLKPYDEYVADVIRDALKHGSLSRQLGLKESVIRVATTAGTQTVKVVKLSFKALRGLVNWTIQNQDKIVDAATKVQHLQGLVKSFDTAGKDGVQTTKDVIAIIQAVDGVIKAPLFDPAPLTPKPKTPSPDLDDEN